MQNVSLEIIDLKGRVVKSFFNRHLLSGSHSIVWDAESYPSGQYLINMSSDAYVKTAKATLIK
jgi:flagellar hook assembly protein FlgD